MIFSKKLFADSCWFYLLEKDTLNHVKYWKCSLWNTCVWNWYRVNVISLHALVHGEREIHEGWHVYMRKSTFKITKINIHIPRCVRVCTLRIWVQWCHIRWKNMRQIGNCDQCPLALLCSYVCWFKIPSRVRCYEILLSLSWLSLPIATASLCAYQTTTQASATAKGYMD